MTFSEHISDNKIPEGWYGEGVSGWGTCVHLWQIHVDAWQNQYSIVKYLKKEKNTISVKGKQPLQ